MLMRMGAARSLKCAFDIDIEYCLRCGGCVQTIAAMIDPQVIAEILAHLHLACQCTGTLTGAATGSVRSGLIAY